MNIKKVDVYFNYDHKKCFKIYYECPITSNILTYNIESYYGYFFNLLIDYMLKHKNWYCMIDNNYEIIYLAGPFEILDRRGFGKKVENLIDIGHIVARNPYVFINYNQYTTAEALLIVKNTLFEINYYDFERRIQILQENDEI